MDAGGGGVQVSRYPSTFMDAHLSIAVLLPGYMCILADLACQTLTGERSQVCTLLTRIITSCHAIPRFPMHPTPLYPTPPRVAGGGGTGGFGPTCSTFPARIKVSNARLKSSVRQQRLTSVRLPISTTRGRHIPVAPPPLFFVFLLYKFIFISRTRYELRVACVAQSGWICQPPQYA